MSRTAAVGDKLLQYFRSLASKRNTWGTVRAGTHQGWEVGSGKGRNSPIPSLYPSGRGSPPLAPNPASIFPPHPGANRGCPGCRAPSPPSAEGTRGPRVAPELRDRAATSRQRRQESPAPGDTRRAAAPATQGSLEREQRFNVRHIKNTKPSASPEVRDLAGPWKKTSQKTSLGMDPERSLLAGNKARCDTGTAQQWSPVGLHRYERWRPSPENGKTQTLCKGVPLARWEAKWELGKTSPSSHRESHAQNIGFSPFLFNQIVYVVTQTSGETGSARHTPIFRWLDAPHHCARLKYVRAGHVTLSKKYPKH